MSLLKASTSRLCFCFVGTGSGVSDELLLNGLRGGDSGSEVSVLKGSSIGGATGSGSGAGAFRYICDRRRGAIGGGGLRGVTLGLGGGEGVEGAATAGGKVVVGEGLTGDTTTDGCGGEGLDGISAQGLSSTASGDAIGTGAIISPQMS